jgi:hypothetical protein
MKFTISHILVTSVLTGAGCCAPVAAAQASPQAVVEAKFAAVHRHATDDIVRLYAPDAQVHSSGFCRDI